MFLRSLEIRGFKSFADKTELRFKKGVTAVVGPNGSGKSNVSDSVRWVLGEQSVKSLRGGKMEDVIFSGTQFRKPLGLAQVSLTLDNSDGELATEYNEVTVTRRIFRSGETEYLINNQKCRLKDITELFMDTGIGKEGYSIIGQGKIDAILSGKPEERRALLEEAAGIVKYKSRKEEAEKRVIEVAEIVKIANQLDKKPAQLSGGQQQRVFLARALVQEADIYLMDEPFKGVDKTTEHAIISLLQEMKARGKTVIVVHHDLNTVPQYFDWVTMVNKQTVAYGPVADTFTEEAIERTYGKGRIV